MQLILIKTGHIRSILQAIISVKELKLPVVIAYRLAKIAKQLEKELEVFEQVRQQLLQQYGKKDEKGELMVENGQVIFNDMKDFQTAFLELIEQNIEIKADKIRLKDLDGVNISVETISQLLPIIDEES